MTGDSSTSVDFELAMRQFVLFVNQLMGGACYTTPSPSAATCYLPRFANMAHAVIPNSTSSYPYLSHNPVLAATGPNETVPTTASEGLQLEATLFRSTDFPSLSDTGVHSSTPIANPLSAHGSLVVANQDSSKIDSLPLGCSHPPHIVQDSARVSNAAGFIKGSHVEVVKRPPLVVPREPTQLRPVTSRKPDFRHQQGKRFLNPKGENRRSSSFKPYCYRCGDRGHFASSCKNALVCFACGRLGHRSYNCSAITALPQGTRPISLPQMANPTPAPLIKLFPNRANRLIFETLMNSLVFHDSYGFGASYIKAHLARLFPEYSHSWDARALPRNMYAITPPDKEWREKIKKKGEIWLGDVCYQVESYDAYQHDGGMEPLPVWVQITGLPS